MLVSAAKDVLSVDDLFNDDTSAADVIASQNMKLITQTGKAENRKVRFISD
jgi:hypothetical protein